MDGPWRSWKEGCNDPLEIMEDGFLAPSNWYLEVLLRRFYAMSVQTKELFSDVRER